jgi:lipopolysaccharide transport system ATP-binding protein
LLVHQALIQLTEVGLCYQRARSLLAPRKAPFWPLQEITLSVFEGETFGIIGRNGAGKSTLLRLLAKILQPDRGKILFQQGVYGSLLSLQVGFVPYLSGRENILLSGLLLGASRKQIRHLEAAIVEYAELAAFIEEPIHTYSTGMRARLGFAIAVHIDPPVLLIDEILGVGDRQFAAKAVQTLTERMASDRTVVLVSHNAELVRRTCSRIVWLEHGRIRQIGPCEEVLDAYLLEGGQPEQVVITL